MSIVYLLQSGKNGPVKIARAANLPGARRRINTLQAGNPEPLILRAATEGDALTEAGLRAHLAAHRQSNDWLEPAALQQLPDDLAWLELDQADEERALALQVLRNAAGSRP